MFSVDDSKQLLCPISNVWSFLSSRSSIRRWSIKVCSVHEVESYTSWVYGKLQLYINNYRSFAGYTMHWGEDVPDGFFVDCPKDPTFINEAKMFVCFLFFSVSDKTLPEQHLICPVLCLYLYHQFEPPRAMKKRAKREQQSSDRVLMRNLNLRHEEFIAVLVIMFWSTGAPNTAPTNLYQRNWSTCSIIF